MLAQFTLGQGSAGQEIPDEQWVAGIRLVVKEPALRGEVVKASEAGEAELAAVIAERTGTDAVRDMYPRLVAGVIGIAIQIAVQQWLSADSPVPIAPLLEDALRQLAAGLPVP